jgi:hypothetical protein
MYISGQRADKRVQERERVKIARRKECFRRYDEKRQAASAAARKEQEERDKLRPDPETVAVEKVAGDALF